MEPAPVTAIDHQRSHRPAKSRGGNWSEDLSRVTCRICGETLEGSHSFALHYQGHIDESRTARRRPLAPLEPQAFAVWSWRQRGAPPPGPLILEDWLFALRSRDPSMDVPAFWHGWVRLAAQVRRNQRLGLDPWEGIA